MTNLSDNYQIIKELGRGGMGAVYLAKDKRLDRMVAVKMLQLSEAFNLQQSSEIISRFQKEAKAIAKLTHPNIVGIHDIGDDNGQHYMVIEFLEGKSVGDLLEEDGHLPIEKSLEIAIDLCKALAYVHENSIVHRDIKPDNIILTKDGIAKLTDFGIAQDDSDQLRLTQDGAILGSVMYISPEQLKNSKDVDNRADIYSFGATLYQMLSGKLPFGGDTVGEVVSKVLSEKPEMLRQINSSIPFELEAIVMKAMNKDPDKRYQNTEDMRADLKNILASYSFKKVKSNTSNLNNSINNQAKNESAPKKTAYLPKKTTMLKPEKASIGTKLFRLGIKVFISLFIIYLSFDFIGSFIEKGIAEQINLKFENSFVQGLYSRSLVESKVNFQSGLASILIALAFLIGSAVMFPFDSKGVHKNTNFGSEILPIFLTLTICSIFTFGYIAKTDSNYDYQSAYSNTKGKRFTDLQNIAKKKGFFRYSNLEDYNSKYIDLLLKENKSSFKVEKYYKQIRNIVFDGDYIKPKFINNESGDKVKPIINELINDIFVFQNPDRFLYEDKVNKLINLVSEGEFQSIPSDIKFKVSKNTNTNLVEKIEFNWDDTNSLSILKGKVSLKVEESVYKYPKIESKKSNLMVNNLTNQDLTLLLYKSGDLVFEKLLVKETQLSIEDLEGNLQHEIIMLFNNKLNLPIADKVFISDGDKIVVDNIYQNSLDYYSLEKTSFPNNEKSNVFKLDLHENNTFITKDADIKFFKLTKIKN